MAIAPVSSAAANVPPPTDPMRQALGQLTSAIQSGNLSTVQSAYATLTQAAGNNPNNPFAQALAQIGDDLQSGDITQTQQDLATLQRQMKGAHHGHGHHHHAGGAGPAQSAGATTSTSNDPTAPASSTNLVDVTA